MDIELELENTLIEYPELRVFYDGECENKSLLQQYFDDVSKVYKKHGNDYDIEFCAENRDKLIEMNLKCVVKVAKRFRGMGLTLEELVSAGNEGLCNAFEKYDPHRNIYREALIEELSTIRYVSREWIEDNIGEYCKYGKLKKRYWNTFCKEPRTVYDADEVLAWVNKNIKKATFNSVAMMWVAAAIRQELDNYSRVIKKPKVKIDQEKTGESKKDVYIDINAPIGEDGNNTIADILYIEDNSPSDLEVSEAHRMMHDMLKNLFTGIKMRDKRILMQKFGLGYVRPMLPKEISERENISVARVSQIINLTIDKMKKNAVKYNIDPTSIFQILDGTSKNF